MAIQRITLVICDKCEGQEDVQSFEIRQGTKKTKIDLCATDRKPLEEILSAAPRRITTRNTPGKRATTVDQIEAKKGGRARKATAAATAG